MHSGKQITGLRSVYTVLAGVQAWRQPREQLIHDVISQAVEKGVNHDSRLPAAQTGCGAEVNGVVDHCPVPPTQVHQSLCSS